MNDHDRSGMLDATNLNASQLGFSQLKSKELVSSHLKSIMPSLRGGKEDDQVKYIFIRIQESLDQRKNLEEKLTPYLEETFGTYYHLKKFKDKSEVLSDDIKDGDLYYIFVMEDLGSWARKFSRQER